jgi:VanZ family protein
VPTPALSPERKPLAVICVIGVLALLWATLRPFNPHPSNGVSWLPDANGIRFAHSGVVFSNEPLKAPADQPAVDACAIEVYVRPGAGDDSGNFLTFSSADNPEAVFLRQWRESLIVKRSIPQTVLGHRFVEFDADDTMHAGKLVLFTVSSGPNGIKIYVDGKLAASAGNFRIRRDELYRQIFIGNSPSSFQVWHGEVRGLAIYDQEISPADAAVHYAEWSSGSQSTNGAAGASYLLARYDFRERGGSVIHSDIASAPPILIPMHFSVPRKAMLDSVVNEFDWSANYLLDVIQNIIGFMPLGFVLCGFFALYRSRDQAILISTFLGGLLSFTIEYLQYYIPRRDSGWTDVITNTTGTLLGALIARPELVRGALRFVHLIPSKRDSEAN